MCSLSARFLPLTHSIYWSRNDKSPARRLKTRDCGARNTFIAVRWKKILKLITFFPPIASLPVWHKNGTPVDGLMISLSCVSGLHCHTMHNERWFVSLLSSTHKILFISLTRGAEKNQKDPHESSFRPVDSRFSIVSDYLSNDNISLFSISLWWIFSSWDNDVDDIATK